MNEILKAALKYREKGFSVIPVRKDKKPYLKWEAFQKKKPDAELIKGWFSKWPYAGIGIVTGEISNLTVIDIDSMEGFEELTKLVHGDLRAPMAKTPKGYHLYFKYAKGVSNKARFIKDCDVRSEGGYIVAPPTKGENGNCYTWMKNKSIFDILPPMLDDPFSNKLINYLYRGDNSQGSACSKLSATTNRQQVTTNDNISFNQGSRDNTLFHVANCLVKGGMRTEKIQKLLRLINARICNPPLPEKEILVKIDSALKRSQKFEKGLTEEIRELVMTTNGIITTTFVYNCQHLTTREEKKKATVVLQRLASQGFLEKTDKAGVYRKVEKNVELVDLNEVSDANPVNIKLPLGIDTLAEIMPKDVIVFAGSPNAGKTAFLLETLRLNMDQWRCWYFSSEMNRYAAKKRISKSTRTDNWTFKFSDDIPNYYDILRPNELNFIDYVEVSEGEYFKIASYISGIQKRLKNGVAVIALQKPRGRDSAFGGEMTTAKPTLYCALNPGEIKIVKAKYFEGNNPNGKTRESIPYFVEIVEVAKCPFLSCFLDKA